MIIAIAFLGCEKSSETPSTDGTREAIEAGLSAYNITEVVLYRTGGSSFNNFTIGGMTKSFDININDEGMSLKVVLEDSSGSREDYYYYPFSYMIEIAFLEIAGSSGDAKLLITLDMT